MGLRETGPGWTVRGHAEGPHRPPPRPDPHVVLTIATACLGCAGGSATAAELRGDGDQSVAEVVVTAQRRIESLQDVPISIAVVSGETVAQPGNINITDLNGLASNVVLQTQGLVANIPMIAIRGMSSSDADPNSEPKISTVVDGVYVPFAAATMLDLFDIERIEILKGPQGALFGKNNLAGTINVITARPTADSGVEVRGTMGSNGLAQFRGKVNSGRFANDMLAVKLAVNVRDYNGYSTNVITGRKLNSEVVQSFRGAIEFNPTADIDSRLVVDLLKEKHTGPAPHVIDNGNPAYQLLPAIVRTDVRKAAIVFDPYANTKSWGLASTTNVKVGKGELTGVIGYRHLSYVTRGDFDGFITPVPGLDVTRDFTGSSKSGELRYLSPIGNKVDYVAGIYYETNAFTQNNTVLLTPTSRTLAVLTQDAESYAGYAILSYHMRDALTLSFGGRYSYDEKKYYIKGSAFVNGMLIAPSSFEGNFSDNWSEFTPRVTAEYRVASEFKAYASYSRGYKAGGYNSRGTVPENVGPYDPETVDAYEIGAKSDLFDRRLRLNAAVFRNDFSDLQASVTKLGALRAEAITTNIAAARTYGLEIDATLRATQDLTLTGGFAYLHARYTDFCADTDGVFTSGAPEPNQCAPAQPVLIGGIPNGSFIVPVDSTTLDLANAPKFNVSLGAEYRVPTEYGTLRLYADGRYASRYNTWGRSNDPAYYRQSATIFNGSIRLDSADSRWSLTLYGRNLTDIKIISGAISAGATPVQQFYQPPREIGIDLAARF